MIDNSLVEVSKTEVSGSSKGVSVPIICIPESEYRIYCEMMAAGAVELKKLPSTYRNTDMSSEALCARLTTIAQNLLSISDHLKEVYNYKYNTDCKNGK